MQYDIDINCIGADYVLKVQPENKQKILALQAIRVYPDREVTGGRNYHLIEENTMISALLEIIIYQGANKRKT